MTLLRAKRPDALAPGLPCGAEGVRTHAEGLLFEPWLLDAREPGVDPARCVVFEDAPAGLRAGHAAGTATVASATTHQADEPAAGLVVEDLSALPVPVTDAGTETSARDRATSTAVRYSDSGGGPRPPVWFTSFHDHDEQPHPCDRGDHDARCSLYVSNVRLLEGPCSTA